MCFVTKSPVTFFLNAPIPGHFYFFFIQLGDSFVAVLYRVVRISTGECAMNRNTPTLQVSPLGMSPTSPIDPSTLPQTSSLSTGRLLILVPADSDYGSAIQRIWQLATATSRGIHLLGLCRDEMQELRLRRQMIAMSALLNDSGVSSEMKIEFGTRWSDALRRNYQTGDIVVCVAEQGYGQLNKPLKQVLEEHVDATIFVLSDLKLQHASSQSTLSLLSSWAGLIGVIAGAFLLQTRILSLPRDWSQTPLMLLSVFGEFWLLWAWNHLFS